jgi:hypothetical protein
MMPRQTARSEPNKPASDTTVEAQARGGVPNAKYIRNHIPVAEVALALELEVAGNKIRCWRPEKHQHGDRTPSVGIDTKRNRVRCFVCDELEYSAIDLVQKVKGLDTYDAIKWIAARFRVLSIPKGRHLGNAVPFRSVSRVGLGGMLEMVVRSGLWASLTPSEKAVLPVLCALSDHTTEGVCVSYRGIRRFSGIGSDTTVARVLHRFEQMHLLNIHRGKDDDGLRVCNRYELTLDDPRLHQLMTELREWEEKEIDAERQCRREQRNMRRRVVAKKPTKSDTSGTIPDSDQFPTPA